MGKDALIRDFIDKIDVLKEKMNEVMEDMLPRLEEILRNIMTENDSNFIEIDGSYVRYVTMDENNNLNYLHQHLKYKWSIELIPCQPSVDSIYTIFEKIKEGEYITGKQ